MIRSKATFASEYANRGLAARYEVTSSWTAATCPALGNAALLADYVYDYANRLAASRSYNGAGTLTDSADYVNDPLDRPVRQTETHGAATTTTEFTYIGISNALSKETLTGVTNTTKRYAYDAHGLRSTITDGANRYSYLYDAHGSVSPLLDQNNGLKASYGYSAYGGKNTVLTKTASGFNASANPYTYTGKRFDTGSNTLDMGARRYSATTGRFLQQDLYHGALNNLNLASNPLLANRYLFTGANPINNVEADGHAFYSAQALVDGASVSYWQSIAPPEGHPPPCVDRCPAQEPESAPEVFPYADSPDPGQSSSRGITAADIRWCGSHPFECGLVWAFRDEAYDAEEHFAKIGILSLAIDRTGDAFRHAYWMGLITLALGESVAKTVGDNHEKSDPRKDPLGPLHWRNARSMDLHNNAIGRSVATSLTGGVASLAMVSEFRDTLLYLLLQQARPGGRLWVLGSYSSCYELRTVSGRPVRDNDCTGV